VRDPFVEQHRKGHLFGWVHLSPVPDFGDGGNRPGELFLGFCDADTLLLARVRIGLRHLFAGTSVVRSQLEKRDGAMEQRARSLAQEAIAANHAWLRPLGSPPSAPAERERWLREVSTAAAYRDRWHIEGQGPLGPAPDRENHEQTAQRAKALSAGNWARAISTPAVDPPSSQAWEPQVEISRGVEI